MSRRSKKTKTNNQKQSRVVYVNARASALRSALGFKPDLSLIEDRRRYTPSTSLPRVKHKEVTNVSRNRPVAPSRKNHVPQEPNRLVFAVPKETVVCVRRQRRKEVLHANKKAGRSGQKKQVRNQFSNFSCKG